MSHSARARRTCRRSGSAPGGHACFDGARGAAPFVEEALRWLPDGRAALGRDAGRSDDARCRRRHAVRSARVLARRRQRRHARLRPAAARARTGEVEPVADGEAALAAIQTRAARSRARRRDDAAARRLRPAARRMRSDPAHRGPCRSSCCRRAPARKPRIEGLEAGADDYLVKPFGARELVARVNVHLELARVRRDATRRYATAPRSSRRLLNAAPIGVYPRRCGTSAFARSIRRSPCRPSAIFPDLIGRDLDEVVHILWSDEYADEIVRHLPAHARDRRALRHARAGRAGGRDRGAIEYYEWQHQRITACRTARLRSRVLLPRHLRPGVRPAGHCQVRDAASAHRRQRQRVRHHHPRCERRGHELEHWRRTPARLRRIRILGQPGAIFFSPEDRAAGVPEREMRAARDEGRAANERWHIRKDARVSGARA